MECLCFTKFKKGAIIMNDNRNYYMKLLLGRSKRLEELLEIAAPTDMICKEVMLLVEAAKPLDPKFRSWAQKEYINEECQPERYQLATG